MVTSPYEISEATHTLATEYYSLEQWDNNCTLGHSECGGISPRTSDWTACIPAKNTGNVLITAIHM